MRTSANEIESTGKNSKWKEEIKKQAQWYDVLSTEDGSDEWHIRAYYLLYLLKITEKEKGKLNKSMLKKHKRQSTEDKHEKKT